MVDKSIMREYYMSHKDEMSISVFIKKFFVLDPLLTNVS